MGATTMPTQPFGHELLGKAMSTLHDHSVLGPRRHPQRARPRRCPRSDLDRQLERIRITLQPLTLEEISKLWTGFATQYRLSAAYEVAVALIESTRPARTPLPVLTRGRPTTAPRAQADLTPPFPALDTSRCRTSRQRAPRGPDVLDGHHLDGTNVVGRVQPSAVDDAGGHRGARRAGGTATQVVVTIPNQPADLAGRHLHGAGARAAAGRLVPPVHQPAAVLAGAVLHDRARLGARPEPSPTR